jgi:bis(5'-nucleosidyl)-tetraphosphatase
MKDPVLSAGVVVVRNNDQGGRYLLLRSFKYWDFPKGQVDPDEDPFAAACREVEEETGLTELNFSWGRVFCATEPYGAKRKVARYYLAESLAGEAYLPVSPELGVPEHHECRWLVYAAAHPILVPRVAAVLEWAHQLTGY